jgi:hypothetical protein
MPLQHLAPAGSRPPPSRRARHVRRRLGVTLDQEPHYVTGASGFYAPADGADPSSFSNAPRYAGFTCAVARSTYSLALAWALRVELGTRPRRERRTNHESRSCQGPVLQAQPQSGLPRPIRRFLTVSRHWRPEPDRLALNCESRSASSSGRPANLPRQPTHRGGGIYSTAKRVRLPLELPRTQPTCYFFAACFTLLTASFKSPTPFWIFPLA